MKLFKVKIDKNKKTTTTDLIVQILSEYPDAEITDIFATAIKHGFHPTIGSIRSYKSDFVRERAIKLAMGVK